MKRKKLSQKDIEKIQTSINSLDFEKATSIIHRRERWDEYDEMDFYDVAFGNLVLRFLRVVSLCDYFFLLVGFGDEDFELEKEGITEIEISEEVEKRIQEAFEKKNAGNGLNLLETLSKIAETFSFRLVSGMKISSSKKRVSQKLKFPKKLTKGFSRLSKRRTRK